MVQSIKNHQQKQIQVWGINFLNFSGFKQSPANFEVDPYTVKKTPSI